jgi:ribosomal protein S27E
MNQLMVGCENCGQELMVDANRPDGTAMTPGEYRSTFHSRGEMVTCDRCAAELGYQR